MNFFPVPLPQKYGSLIPFAYFVEDQELLLYFYKA
jgi:hypothetical protein